MKEPVTRIEQQAGHVLVHTNPDLERCAWEKCGEILFGDCVLCTITEKNTVENKKEVRKWMLCSPECYVKFDAWFEERYMEWVGDAHIATIDPGIPDEWSD
jgi:hypothetical protein